MQRFLTLALALCIGLSFSFDAEARRFGGGKSWGAPAKHRPAQQRQQQQQQPKQQPGQKGSAAAGKTGMVGALAGLAAGGLLASMFFGGAFDGFKFFDILILAAIAFFLYRFIASRRQPSMQTAGAGPQPMQREMTNNLFGSSNAQPQQQPVMQAPSWFNQQRFVEQAREHFMQLQQLWDANDFSQIAAYLTPEMRTFLEKERASLGDGFQSTYIEQLEVQLDGIEELEDYTVATLSFTGVAKTSRFEQGESFHESWRMERAHGDNESWLIAGIQQNN